MLDIDTYDVPHKLNYFIAIDVRPCTMRINIIQPTHYKDPLSRQLFKVDKLSVSPLTLPYLAALMPKGIDLRLMDERTGGLDIKRRV